MILYFIKRAVAVVFFAYTLMLLARIVGSWFPQFAESPIMRVVATYTDPYLGLFKRFIPPIGMIDISSMAALFSLQLGKWLIFLVL